MTDTTDNVLDLMDSEIERMAKVVDLLHERQSQGSVNLEAFRREAIDRFAEVGFEVGVKCWTTDVPGVFAFDFEIISRLAGRFDPDQQVHEVVNDILHLGEGGVIKTEVGPSGLHAVGHGHSHSHKPHKH